jgi:hypothetical protein
MKWNAMMYSLLTFCIQAAQDLTKESRQKVLLLQHRANTLMDEKKKLRSQTEQSDLTSATKWKDAEHRIEEVEIRLEDMKKLLATESMLRKKADRTVKFLRAQLVQVKKEADALISASSSPVKEDPASARPVSRTSNVSSHSSRRSSASDAASSESEISSTKSGSRNA